ncbi:plasmid replication, integration and excision activator [Promicromonospora sp. NPDC019610]|uniref:plasmid replication, integration and excision activator n=1 Tax=Promicromonospora sp. NPDC019610 TaxID=3364405 RepID=UPI0037B3FB6E
MAMQRRFAVNHEDVFPKGAFLKGEVEPVQDFQADKRPDGSRPQQRDKDTGLPLWQVVVLDADEEAGKKDTAVTVKIAAPVQPVPPTNNTPFPWTPIEFVGLTALPYVDDNGTRPRLAWSYKAEDLCEPGKADVATSARPDASKAA